MLFLLSGCVTTPMQVVTLPDGRVYSAEVSSGTLAEVTAPDGTRVLFNRQGRPSILEDVIKLYTIDMLSKD